MGFAKDVKTEDIEGALSHPKEAIKSIGRAKEPQPAVQATNSSSIEDRGPERDGSHAGLVVMVMLLLALGGYLMFSYLTKPRQVGRPMLGDDFAAEGVAMTGHWMGASARDMIATSQGGNSAEFNRF